MIRRNASQLAGAVRPCFFSALLAFAPAGRAALEIHLADVLSPFFPATTPWFVDEGMGGGLVVRVRDDNFGDLCDPTSAFSLDVTIDVESQTDAAGYDDIVESFPMVVTVDSAALCSVAFSYPGQTSGWYADSVAPPYTDLVKFIGFSAKLDGIPETGVEGSPEPLTFVITNVAAAGVAYTIAPDAVPGTAINQYVIYDGNNAPEFSPNAPLLTAAAVENQPFTLALEATDVDTWQALSFSVANQPTGSTLANPGPHYSPAMTDFTWTPGYDQQGNHAVTFIVSDNDSASPLSDQVTVTITVGNVNRPPVLDPIGNQVLAEAQTFNLDLSATDPDNDALTFSVSNPPTGSSLTDNADGTARFSWMPDHSQAGNYPVTFTVTDADAADPQQDSEAVTLSVGNTNRPPILDPIGSRVVSEGATLNVQVSGSDPDGDAISFDASNLPSGAVFSSTHGTFSWTPNYAQAGNYTVGFYVYDDGTPPLQDYENVTISVGDTNRPPVLAHVGNRSVDEGATLTITLSASDPDGGNLSYAVSGQVPAGAVFSGRTFTWTPDYTAGGLVFNLVFSVSDGRLSDTESIAVTVGNVNRPPVLEPIGNRSINVGRSLRIQAVATDQDGDALSYAVTSGLPEGATFAGGVLQWTPAAGQVGNHSVVFQATDDGDPPASAAESIQIQVFAMGDVNQDGAVDVSDVALIMAYARLPVDPEIDLLDVDGDGRISVADARRAAGNCSLPNCAAPSLD